MVTFVLSKVARRHEVFLSQHRHIFNKNALEKNHYTASSMIKKGSHCFRLF